MKIYRTVINKPNQASKPSKSHALSSIFLSLISLVVFMNAAQAQTVPVATASTTTQLLPSFTNPVVGRIATNSNGDAIYVNAPYYGNSIVYWLPHGTTTPVVLATTTGSSTARNAYVDSSNNIFVPNLYGDSILEIPYVGGAYTPITNFGNVANCTSYKPTAACFQFGGVGAVAGYYYQPVDMGLDKNGNAYVLDVYSNGNCTNNCILKFTRNNDAGQTYTATLVISNIAPSSTAGEIAVDPNGDIFYADGTLLETIAAGTTTAKPFGTGFTNPTGVSTDSFGNLYVTNSASPYGVFEFPVLNGVVQASDQFAVVGDYSNTAVGVDDLGDLYYVGYSGGATLNVANVNAIPVGSSPVGTPVSATATNITFTFSGSTQVAGITSNGPGFTYSAGSCAAGSTYAANGSCTVNVSYTPTAVGLQRGAISLTNAAGATIASALLSGVGTGPAQTTDPGMVTAIGSGFTSPTGLAVDGAGNVFVADPGQNAVLRYAGGSGTPTNIGTGLAKPTSVALDNAGDVFIADSGNGRIVEVPNYNGTLTNSAQTTIYTGIGATVGIAFDYAGNLYIADTGNTSVTQLLNIGGLPRSTNAVSLGTFKTPIAVAPDANGNIFVADYSGNSVSRINYLGKAATIVSTAFSHPTGVASDASGSVYVADSGNSRLVKVPLEGTAFNTNDQYLVGASVAVPYAVARDASANLYVADSANAAVSMINRTAGVINLGRVQIPNTSSAQNATIADAGNVSLIFGTPQYTQTSLTPTYFSVTSPSGNGCTDGETLAAGYACLLSATFTPTTTGSFSDLLTFTSNAVNASVKTLTLTGTGVNLALDQLTLTQTSGPAVFGSPVTIQAAVTSTVAGTPTGTVSFTVDGNQQSTAPSINSSGVANIQLAGLTGGSHVICGAYTGDNSYRPANSCITITVAKVSTTTALTISGTSSTAPLTSSVTQQVTMTATVTPGANTPPSSTSTVTFTVGGTVLGTANVLASGSLFQATLQTSALPAGTDVVTATYNGDVNYLTSFGTDTIIVTYPTILVTPTTNNLTVTAPKSGTLPLTLTALGGFNGFVGLQCSGLPANTVCTFSPNQIILNDGTSQTQAVTLTVFTGQTPVQPQPVVGSIGGRGLLGAFAGLLLTTILFWSRRRTATKLSQLSFAVVTLLIATFVSGCGGSGLVGTTPKGTYNVTIIAVGSTDPGPTSTPTPYAYSAYAPGCTAKPSTSIQATCTETAALTLVVQ